MLEHYFNIVLYFFSNWDYSFVMIPVGTLFVLFCFWLVNRLMRGKYRAS